MSNTNSDPAFPSTVDNGDGGKFLFTGMSMLDYFAGQAMNGMLSCQDFMNEVSRQCESKEDARKMVAQFAYRQAFAMLTMRTQVNE